MRILIVGLNYLPESTSIGPYTAELAQDLQMRGHDVSVITSFPAAPQWEIWAGYRGRIFMREVINGIRVFRTYVYVPRQPRKAVQRVLFDCSFAVSALAGMFLVKRPDLVIVISPPLQLAITARIIGAVRRAPMFLYIQDLVPDAAVAVGALRPGSVALRIAQVLERFAYRASAGIGVICDGMRRNLIAKGVAPDKVVVLPDYINLSFMSPPPANGFRARLGFPHDEFVVMYSGSVAGKQGLQTFVRAAAQFEESSGVTCCLIGEGAYLPDLTELAGHLGLKRTRFLPMQPRESLPEQLSAADVLIITQRKAVKDMVFPGKLLYYMASGRPILASVSEDSETGRFILENEVGIVVPPEDPDSLAEAIRWMRANSDRARDMGLNGRRVVETHFDRVVVAERFARHLEELGGIRKPLCA